MNQVTTYLGNLGKNSSMSLQDLTGKTVMLMALTRPSRSADLSQLNLRFRRYLPEGVTFKPTKLAKQSRQGKTLQEFFFPSFPLNKLLCPVDTLKAYEERTKGNRGDDRLFLIKPHKPVCSSTIARWLRTTLTHAGINTDVF